MIFFPQEFIFFKLIILIYYLLLTLLTDVPYFPRLCPPPPSPVPHLYHHQPPGLHHIVVCVHGVCTYVLWLISSLSLTPWDLSVCSMYPCLWSYFVCQFILFIRFLIGVKSRGTCLSLAGLFHFFLIQQDQCRPLPPGVVILSHLLATGGWGQLRLRAISACPLPRATRRFQGEISWTANRIPQHYVGMSLPPFSQNTSHCH